MDKNDVLKMLKAEMKSKVDAGTLDRLKAAKSPDEALSILEGASVSLSDDMLAAVSGGAGETRELEGLEGLENLENVGWCNHTCKKVCPDYCWIF